VRILGLDPGEKRIGVAITDPLGITAQGVKVITYTSMEEALEQIKKICLDYEVDKVVIGHPLNMNGSRGPASEKALLFATRLQQMLGVSVVMVDERLSSVSAEKTLISAGVSRKNRRDLKDKLAATLILELYLSSQKSNSS